MTYIRNILYVLLLCLIFISCSTGDDVFLQDSPQTTDLLLSVGNTEYLTRQASDIIQSEGEPFRGLNGLLAIPFRTSNGGLVTVSDIPLISTALGDNGNRVNEGYFYYLRCDLMQGTNRVLVYGQAKKSEDEEKATDSQNGKLETTLVGRMLPANIFFNLSQISKTTNISEDAQALVNYLTAIAKTEGWSTTSNSQLKALYLQFIHADTPSTGLMAGSATNVKAYADALRKQLLLIDDELSTKIITNIDNDDDIDANTYPASIGLPDGAAALRWTGEKFSVRTQTTTIDNINAINRYAYPAELWYYVNSAIYTSSDEVDKNNYVGKTWEQVLNTYYKGSHSVISSTKAVAVEESLQYGVGRLKMTLSEIASTLNDSKGQELTPCDMETFPLTGVIIGGQHTVGFDFKPKGTQSDVDARFIYDSEVGTAGTDGKWIVNTLVLQSYDGEKVPVVLEFTNKSGYQFTGKDGIIYPGTKFYLIGQLDPADKGADNYAGRVFTQDYTTKVSMKVTSLANAYSCMPDLLAPRLEIGVEVTTDWIQSTTTNVML